MFRVTKSYPHSLGLSCCFRQWRAESHCKYLHGYALAFTIELEAETLDARNWVLDFGAFKPIKDKLFRMFDHRLLVAVDDPARSVIWELNSKHGLAQVMQMKNVGCEAFAALVATWVKDMLIDEDQAVGRVRLVSVTCHEHEGNSATYLAD